MLFGKHELFLGKQGKNNGEMESLLFSAVKSGIHDKNPFCRIISPN